VFFTNTSGGVISAWANGINNVVAPSSNKFIILFMAVPLFI
jgi:hypothetical protein